MAIAIDDSHFQRMRSRLTLVPEMAIAIKIAQIPAAISGPLLRQ
ncbi:hypothetical protein [Oscillatoria acuminata]|nr:hypothetical protein [Oscillatoria acuminata]